MSLESFSTISCCLIHHYFERLNLYAKYQETLLNDIPKYLHTWYAQITCLRSRTDGKIWQAVKVSYTLTYLKC